MDLTAELQRICEINVEVGRPWDGGIDVRLGDRMNGFLAEENVGSIADIVPWLQEAIAHFYPDSTYARSLEAEVRDQGARGIFLPPRAGAQVRCPHCGAPNAAHEMEKVFAFYCARCGNSVQVEEPKVN